MSEKPQVIWESEHPCGTRFRIVRRQEDNSTSALAGPDLSIKHVLERSRSDAIDAMGVRTWDEANPTKQAVVEVLMAALLRELPK